jgi:large subunit ribosomal protein L23
MSKLVTLKPRMSEKAYNTTKELNTYVFEIPKFANKIMTAKAVEELYKVSVKDVKIAVIKGKVKKSYQKRNRPVDGLRVTIKKAYVRLNEGQTINIFGEDKVQDAEVKAQAQNAKITTKDTKQKRGLKGVLGRSPRQTQNRGGEK